MIGLPVTKRVAHLRNSRRNPAAACRAAARLFPADSQREASQEILSWDGYQVSPLLPLRGLASATGVGEVWLKDEGARFGLGSFKALGGAYAVTRLAGSGSQTFACATDGNHGRAVAWGARRLGARCIIYLHAGVSGGRESALRELGAGIVRVAGSYDDSVHEVALDAAANGWTLVGDTSDDERDPAAALVMAGYTVLIDEIAAQLLHHAAPTHLFVQAGVGGLAAAVIAGVCRYWAPAPPRIVVVEPEQASCVFRSLAAGERVTVPGDLHTLMAGLACGKVSGLAWPLLEAGVSDAVVIRDDDIPGAMRLMFAGHRGDPKVICGESGVAGVAALLASAQEAPVREALGLEHDSRVLLINTEGATDAKIFASLVPDAAGICVAVQRGTPPPLTEQAAPP
jgi:diaminopropionate ammonia-lyase